MENGDNNLSKVGFRGTTRRRIGEIISVLAICGLVLD